MSFFKLLATAVAEEIAEQITDEVILQIRKKTKMIQLGGEAVDLKKELHQAESTAEREAVLDKVHDLINSFGEP